MPIKQVFKDGQWPVKVYTDSLDKQAEQQLRNLSHLPFIHHHVAAMPDAHGGIGATIGSVIPTRGAIIPAAVGVDIGCGMMATRLAGITAKDLPDSLSQIRFEIETVVPVGFAAHDLDSSAHRTKKDLWSQFQWILEKHSKAFERRKKSAYEIIASQYGSLGGGNHFIELCLDENDEVWVMLHSGSRGIGNAIGQYFIELAREDMRKYFINLPDKDLAYFVEDTWHFNDYCSAVLWAQDYARFNREEMMHQILAVMKKHVPSFDAKNEAINCHHNYVERENHYGSNVWVTRKGAIRARSGDLGIIPGSMGAKSYIVRGKGNDESFHSCSHGAGRRMSRSKAKQIFTIKDLKTQTQGIECRKDKDVIDEIPGAYKNIDEVMANQTDLVEVVHTLHQVLNIKG